MLYMRAKSIDKHQFSTSIESTGCSKLKSSDKYNQYISRSLTHSHSHSYKENNLNTTRVGSYSCLGVICRELEGVLAKSFNIWQKPSIGDYVPRKCKSYIVVTPEK